MTNGRWEWPCRERLSSLCRRTIGDWALGIRHSLVIGHWSLVISLAVYCALLSGCSPKRGEPLHSQFFSEVQIIGTRGTAPGQLNKPRSVAVDANDNLFVVDMTGRVQKFSPAGVFLSSWQMPQTDKGKPKGMCRDAEGNIVVVEPHYSRVNHFTPAGQSVRQWGVHGTNVGELALPRAVAVNRHGTIFVSEYGVTERVQMFSVDGRQLLRVIGREGPGPGEFNRAEGLGLDATDRLYVADSCNHRVQVFSPEGQWLRSYGHAGTGPGELSYPYDVRVDAAGFQYVCEFGNSRIQIFDAQDKTVEILGGPGTEPGRFSNPWSIALDSHGDLYVADANNHRVQKFLRSPNAKSPKSKVQSPKSTDRGSPSRSASRRPGASKNSSIPKGLCLKAQGCEERATLGKLDDAYNPEGVATPWYRNNGYGHNPVGVGTRLRSGPRVARSSQPWALLRNPFGIQDCSAHLAEPNKDHRAIITLAFDSPRLDFVWTLDFGLWTLDSHFGHWTLDS